MNKEIIIIAIFLWIVSLISVLAFGISVNLNINIADKRLNPQDVANAFKAVEIDMSAVRQKLNMVPATPTKDKLR